MHVGLFPTGDDRPTDAAAIEHTWSDVTTQRFLSGGADVEIKMANATFFFTPLVLLLIPEHCHDEFFVDFNFFHGELLLYLWTHSYTHIQYTDLWKWRFMICGCNVFKITMIDRIMLSHTVPCLKIAISKGLGYGIVVGSAMSEYAPVSWQCLVLRLDMWRVHFVVCTFYYIF